MQIFLGEIKYGQEFLGMFLNSINLSVLGFPTNPQKNGEFRIRFLYEYGNMAGKNGNLSAIKP